MAALVRLGSLSSFLNLDVDLPESNRSTDTHSITLAAEDALHPPRAPVVPIPATRRFRCCRIDEEAKEIMAICVAFAVVILIIANSLKPVML